MAAAAPQNDGICVKAYPSQRWQLKSLPGERVHTCPLTERGRARAHAHSGAKRRKMVKKREGLSVAQEIDGLEEKLSLCRQSMEEVDLKLLREELSPEGRKSLERERSLLVTKAETYERELKVLRQENRKNAAIAMAIVLLIIVVYTCWTM
ncbi:coiled-coil domain-containing protein 167 isoform X4 [Mauremys reevesii]|uniref:coiled-coil domain-containing protein 167 isoform X4 n=1 Tax=Mauremys reevesii TaxID=260615 RepID=UPI00193FAA5D|nr:coiled-coil domain-containing protein 167 isoform X4 [Mauremys reevesii]